jgi:hypothetical protein
MSQCIESPMTQGSTHEIQLNPVAPLTVERVTAMTLKYFKIGSKVPFITKTLGDGIEPVDNHWIVSITGTEVTAYGKAERQLQYIDNGKPYTRFLGTVDIRESK